MSDELETVKARMDERGNSMTDTSPLIKMKRAPLPLQPSAVWALIPYSTPSAAATRPPTQPLTRSALTQLRIEAKQMEIRIGIVNHTLVAWTRKNPHLTPSSPLDSTLDQVTKKLKSDSATRAEASVPKNKHIKHEAAYMSDDDLTDY